MKWNSYVVGLCAGLTLLSASAQELTGTLKKIKETGTITLGVRESSIPFSYLDDKQAFRGYSIDMCSKIVAAVQKQLGLPSLNVKMQPITSATRIPLMVNGTIDITCGSDANTVDRQKQVAFSWTTFVGNEAMVSKKSANINTAQDLKGKTVVSTSGSTDIKHINDLNKARDLGMKVTLGPDHAASFLALETGRADVFIMTDILIASLVANSKAPNDYNIKVVDEMPVEPWALMMRRDDPAFRKVVNDVIAQTFGSGEINQLYAKWFQSPLPYLNINLNIPMSAKLKAVIAKPSDSGDPKDYR
jgi:glutamate/aspartate transport system substrate-binding protein